MSRKNSFKKSALEEITSTLRENDCKFTDRITFSLQFFDSNQGQKIWAIPRSNLELDLNRINISAATKMISVMQ